MLQAQNATQNDHHATSQKPTYTPPKITEYDEDDLLKTVAVLGCSPF